MALWMALVVPGIATAFDATYLYDANHRLVGVLNSTGNSTRYVYDDLGNLVRTDSLAPSQFAILGFSPEHGAPGTPVSIFGQGFSTTAASNTVEFNGTAATVASSNANQLQVTVPTGATTGLVSVASGSNSASSDSAFTVDGTGLAPTITAVSPLGANPGTTITLTGSHLDPVAGATSVTLNGAPSILTTATDTQLKFNVPTVFGSGKILVTTPYGQATSGQDFFTYPAEYASGYTINTGRIVVDGVAASVPLGSSKAGIRAFDATVGDWISLQTPALGSSVDVETELYDPHGLRIGPEQFLDRNSPSLHLLQIPQSGTYTLVMWNGTSTTLSVTASHDPVITTAAPYAFSTTVPYSSKRILFQAPPGKSFGLGFTNVQSSEVTYGFYVTGFEGAGVPLDSGYYCQPSATLTTCSAGYPAFAVDPQKAALPLPGWKQVILQSEQDTTSSATVQLVADQVGTSTTGAMNEIAFAKSGQNSEQTLALSAGQPIAIEVASATTTPSGDYVDYSLYDPDGIKVFSNSTGDSSHDIYNLDPLTKSGTYTFYVNPPDGETGSMSYRILASPLVAASPNGPGVVVSTATSEQYAFVTFNAAAGASYTVTCQSSNDFVDMALYGPDGTLVDNSGYCGSSSEPNHVTNVPVAGVYKSRLVSDDPTMTSTITVTSP
jgi:YD repeat-containing protein